MHLDKLFLVTLGLGLLATTTAHAQLGVGTCSTAPRPGTLLDVNGPIASYETTLAATGTTSPTAAIATATGQVQLTTGSATAGPIAVSYTAATPVAGQRLVLFNAAAYAATFSGQSIPVGQAVEFVYSAGGWQASAGGGNSSTYTANPANGGFWGLTGNSGTTPGTNFLGTTDANDVIFKRSGTVAGKLGVVNTSFGTGSLPPATSTGFGNTAIGSLAGAANTAGFQNTLLGYQAGTTNTTGNNNTFAGYQAGTTNTTGSNNVFEGYGSGQYNVSGSANVFSGVVSGSASTTGNSNVFVGYSAGGGNISGGNNTALGYGAGPGAANLNNTTAIGNSASVSASNKIRFGNTAVTVIEGQVAYSVASDARFKYDVQQNVPGLRFISQLRPVTYHFDDARLDAFTKTGQLQPFTPDAHAALKTGFLAQDVEKAALALGYHFDGVNVPTNAHDHYTLSYAQFVVPLVRAVQEEQTEIEALQAANAALTSENATLRASLAGKASASTLTELQAALHALRAEVQTLKATGTTASK